MSITWELVDHACRSCGGRILRSVKGAGMTPGGNPLYRCSCCGKGGASMGPDVVCWCGFGHRAQQAGAYLCLPFSILKERPELERAFRACGCVPGRQEVGVMLERDYREVLRKTTQAAAPEGNP